MAAIAHSPEFAKKVGVSQSVGKDFTAADKGRKFKEGGSTMNSEKARELRHAATLRKVAKEEETEAKKYAGGGFVRAADGIAQRGKTKGAQIKMCGGGKVGRK